MYKHNKRKHMKTVPFRSRLAALLLINAILLPAAGIGQDAKTAEVFAAIRKEGMENSKIMNTMHYLTDLYGPRLTGSPNHVAAARWAAREMTSWGLENAALEPWEFGRPGWVNERAVGLMHKPVQDTLTFEVLAWTPSTNGIIIGAGVAKKSGLVTGSNVSVVSGHGVTLQMKVVGIFETGIVTLDDAQGYVNLKKNQILQRRIDVVNQIRLRLDDIDRADEVAREIEARHGYKTESWRETNQNIFGIFVIQNGIMYSTVGAILVVSGFGIYNIVSTVVNEKRHDVAILKSIGYSERDIRRIFLLQGLIVGLVGTLLGWVLGFLLIQLLASIRFDIQGMIRTQGFVLNRSLVSYGVAGLIAVAVSALAAYLPARKAAALNPVDVIRGGA